MSIPAALLQGNAIIFDIATFHTAQPNTSSLDRENVILMYTSSQGAQNTNYSTELLQQFEAAGRLTQTKRSLLGMEGK
jgi:ectoine hydroxylase-related dioxygenase (phytanoyl-CoA dioxygenase family)